MKIWLAENWYLLPDHVLVVYLENRDKANIENMHPDCDLYCQYDEKVFDTKEIIKLLERLKHES